jgi:NMD protein affecting ribosome stability and mRNA decay
MAEEQFVNCDICARPFPAESNQVSQIGVDVFRCNKCDYSPYPEDWYDEDEDEVEEYIVRRCVVCGGEAAEDWSTCDCDDGGTFDHFGG